MTKQEAIQAMREGKKVTHRHFTGLEWVATNQSESEYIFEDGVKCSAQLFWALRSDESWETDWELWNEKLIEK